MIAPKLPLKGRKLSLYALLFLGHGRIVATILGQRFAQHIVRFVDFTLIKVQGEEVLGAHFRRVIDRKSTRLNSSHANISYAVFCLKKKKTNYSVSAPQ